MNNDEARIHKKISSAFKLSGFILKGEVCNFLVNQFMGLSCEEQEKWIDSLIEHIQNQKLNSVCIEKNHIETAINEITEVHSLNEKSIFKIINAYDIPRCIYNSKTKKFKMIKGSQKFLTEANEKIKYLQNRYIMLYQKTIHNELFSSTAVDTFNYSKKSKLLYIENLLSTSTIDNVIVLGLLTQYLEGKFFLEDLTGVVQLDLTNVNYHSGLFCEGCFVLIKGKYQDKIIQVTDLELPPIESAKSSLQLIEMQDNDNDTLKFRQQLLNIEKSNVEDTIVFLSDVRLDLLIVMEKLKLLFDGYNSCPPVAIVLMGPFCKPYENNIQKIKNLFKNLGDLVVNCDRLKRETDLILIPSLEDIGAPHILPRSSIPECLVEELKQKWNRVKLATNPCRLNYCTQQIVVFRADLITKFCRNTLHFPKSGQIEDHFVQTIISQGHLAPINSNALPVFWSHDAALWLYPLPDLIVIGDLSNPFSITKSGCSVLNTGSFIRSKFEFKVYVPSTRVIEDSSLE